MVLEADVVATARRFGIDPILIQAVVRAEGDIVKAVQCSIPSVKTRQEALDITCRSAVHAMSDFVKAAHGQAFVAFWGARWAPIGATNDPTHLNQHWVSNVASLWGIPPVAPTNPRA